MSDRNALATMIIAIDGPAGSGKSTVARRLAAALGLTFLDTGAMYRAVTLAALERDVEPMDERGCAELARTLRLSFDAQGRILIDGQPGEPAIRSDEVTRWVSAVSAHTEVRRAIVPEQRSIAARSGGVVAEGRDTGTVVFPRADFKFFLTASAEERARRRSLEKREPERFAEHLADIQRRDHHDSTRHDSPLRKAEDALQVDTTGLDADGVVAKLLETIRGRADG
jgi:cytidylate kinase